MTVYDASTCISAEFGGIRDLSRHLSLNYLTVPTFCVRGEIIIPTSHVRRNYMNCHKR